MTSVVEWVNAISGNEGMGDDDKLVAFAIATHADEDGVAAIDDDVLVKTVWFLGLIADLQRELAPERQELVEELYAFGLAALRGMNAEAAA